MTTTVIDMTKMDEEILTPSMYLKLTPEQRRNIIKVSPVVQPLELSNIEDSSFALLVVKWKTPRYRARL